MPSCLTKHVPYYALSYYKLYLQKLTRVILKAAVWGPCLWTSLAQCLQYTAITLWVKPKSLNVLGIIHSLCTCQSNIQK